MQTTCPRAECQIKKEIWKHPRDRCTEGSLKLNPSPTPIPFCPWHTRIAALRAPVLPGRAEKLLQSHSDPLRSGVLPRDTSYGDLGAARALLGSSEPPWAGCPAPGRGEKGRDGWGQKQEEPSWLCTQRFQGSQRPPAPLKKGAGHQLSLKKKKREKKNQITPLCLQR